MYIVQNFADAVWVLCGGLKPDKKALRLFLQWRDLKNKKFFYCFFQWPFAKSRRLDAGSYLHTDASSFVFYKTCLSLQFQKLFFKT